MLKHLRWEYHVSGYYNYATGEEVSVLPKKVLSPSCFFPFLKILGYSLMNFSQSSKECFAWTARISSINS